MTKKSPTLDLEDHGTIVICALRYAMGRQTYMPRLVMDYVKRNWGVLNECDRDIIHGDVLEGIERERTLPGRLGSLNDEKDWRAFADWLSEHK